MLNQYIQALVDKFKEDYAIKIIAGKNEFYYRIHGVMPVDKNIRLWVRDPTTGVRRYTIYPGESQDYSMSDNTNIFFQTDNHELMIFTLGVIDGIAAEVYSPPTSPHLGVHYEPDAYIVSDKSPVNDPDTRYRFKSFRRDNYVVAPRMKITNYSVNPILNPYIRMIGVRLSIRNLSEKPETYTTINLFDIYQSR